MRHTDAAGACSVCGQPGAKYEHEGRRYCVRNPCQLVAAGEWTPEQARADLRRRGYAVTAATAGPADG